MHEELWGIDCASSEDDPALGAQGLYCAVSQDLNADGLAVFEDDPTDFCLGHHPGIPAQRWPQERFGRVEPGAVAMRYSGDGGARLQ